MMMEKITIVGVGLIGSSIAYDLKTKALVKNIFGVDNDVANLDNALAKGIIDNGLLTLTQEALDVDLLLIATPVSVVADVLQQLSGFKLKKNLVITDVGSTKRSIIKAFEHYLPAHVGFCVAAHPVAGCEKSGAENALLNLFTNNKVIICPHPTQNINALNTVKLLWQSLGALIYEMDAVRHDQIFAMTSHLPHLPAYAYINLLAKKALKNDYLLFAGSGFRDFTRIAAGDPTMWADICMDNQDFLLELLEQYSGELQYIKQCLINQDKLQLKKYFAHSQQVRQKWEES